MNLQPYCHKSRQYVTNHDANDVRRREDVRRAECQKPDRGTDQRKAPLLDRVERIREDDPESDRRKEADEIDHHRGRCAIDASHAPRTSPIVTATTST